MKNCIFIFRRDLRLTDNTALIQAQKTHEKILPVFIYDVNQISRGNNNFLAVQEQAINDLDNYIRKYNGKLYRFYGTPYKVINYLIKIYKPATVAFNMDYSCYAQERDKKIAEICKQNNVNLFTAHDVTLYDPVQIRMKYDRLFGVFAESVSKLEMRVQKNGQNKYENICIEKQIPECPVKFKPGKIPVTATREWTLKVIKNNADVPISCALKLGLISPREIFKYYITNPLPRSEKVIRGLIWREFYFATWLTKSNHYDFYDPRFKTIEWRNDAVEMRAMWKGRTGVPIIDACMRELNETGFMWNRGRLLVGFYSVKILRINPFFSNTNTGYYSKLFSETSNNIDTGKYNKKSWYVGGQLYFSNKLIDCCYANNTGNWHWVASDLLDASGQRFGHGWSGRKYNVVKLKPEEKKYLEKWKPEKRDCAVDIEQRWSEWLEMTKG